MSNSRIQLIHPLPGGVPTSGFGWRPAFTQNGVYVPAMFHNGQDYAAPAGTLIRAAHDGTVSGVFYDSALGGGWMVRIHAAFGYTLYGHMLRQSPYVKVGDKVRAGQTIGEVGATGLATGTHLHFILNRNGTDVNPVPYITTSSAPGSTQKKGLTVIHYHRQDKRARDGGRRIPPGTHDYLDVNSDANSARSRATNIVGGIGPYSITVHVGATGAPGEHINVVLIWQKDGKNSRHYTERMVFDKDGQLLRNVEFKRSVPAGFRVFSRVENPASNTKDVRVTLHDTDAYLIK